MSRAQTRPAALEIAGARLLRHGRPHQILSGAMHYFRVHPDLWQDRLQRLRALGFNSVDTYVAWNFHQPTAAAAPRWDGWCDVERFVRLAGEADLDVMLRPGPYICAEWAGGGLPTFVTDTPGLVPRSSDPAYLRLLEPWLDELIPRIAALQSVHGGPITSVQVENEYGSYGDDRAYLTWLRDALVDRGIRELLFTADGPTDLMLDGGTIDGVWATATFGSDPDGARRLLGRRRADEPFLCAELWCGWFDHWGEMHHVRAADSAAGTTAEVIADGGSVNIYMAHGGSNFALWAGANHDGHRLQPTITSYDSDAPIAEHGAITAKGRALRELFARTTGGDLPDVPAGPPVLPPQALDVTPGLALLSHLRTTAEPVRSRAPLAFSSFGQPSGMLLHRATPVIPDGEHRIRMLDLHDRATVYVDGVRVGDLDDVTCAEGVPVSGAGRPVVLEVLVEDRGRINYGPLLGQDKGVLGGVLVDRRLVHGWETIPLTVDTWADAELSATSGGDIAAYGEAGLAYARFAIDAPRDTFLALPGFGRGFVWVNGELLGRYDAVGPQATYYVPAPLLQGGDNEVTVLELERIGRTVELRDEPDLGEPEPYIETFD